MAKSVTKGKTLSPNHARFVEEYLVVLNAAEAARRAGYSKKSAKEQGFHLLQRPEIQEAIKAATDERSKRTQVSQDEVVEGLKEEANLTGDGSSPAARVQAWAWLGRHLAMFTDNTNLGGSVGIRHEDALKDLE